MTRAVVFAYHNVGMRCLAVLLAHGVEVPLVFTHEDDVRIRIPSIDKARRILGWEPLVTLEEALGRCVAQAPALYRTQ